MKYFFILGLLTLPICAFSDKNQQHPLGDLWIEFGPFLYYDDDDDLYEENFYNDAGVNVWVGPGVYYGFWFDNEYQYRRWARDHYYYRHRERGSRHYHHGGGGHHRRGGGRHH